MLSLQTAATALGILGIALNILLAWPQVWRAARRGGAGVSMVTVLIGFGGRALWSAYAVRAQDLALFIGQAPVAIGFAAIGFFVSRDRRSGRASALFWSVLVTSLVVSVVLAIWAPVVLTVIAVVFAAAVSLPQMIGTLRRGESLAGVSEWMYWFTSAASATWLSYGLIVDFAISLPHFVVLPTSLITAIVVHRRNRRAPGAADPPL